MKTDEISKSPSIGARLWKLWSSVTEVKRVLRCARDDGGGGGVVLEREPVARAGHWSWWARAGNVRCLFFGKPAAAQAGDPEAELAREGLAVARLRQIHSARLLEAQAGDCGEGDALLTTETGLALRVVTADCVPVLLLSPRRIAAVHAGWRGLEQGIVGAAARCLLDSGPAAAVIGPAIRACCYEVGEDVAQAVARAVGAGDVVSARGEGRRPHLDLQLAARRELERAGVAEVATLEACTRCETSRLWSYRREGGGAGRNLAYVWLETGDRILIGGQ